LKEKLDDSNVKSGAAALSATAMVMELEKALDGG
jgi:hypothetical protein